MIFDEIAAERGLVAKLRDLTTNGSLELLVTSKQAEECQLAQRPDLLAPLNDVPVRVIGAAPFLLDVSRLDVDRAGQLSLTTPFEPLPAAHGIPRPSRGRDRSSRNAALRNRGQAPAWVRVNSARHRHLALAGSSA